MNSRCQVKLIDMQTHADNEFKFITIYQDRLIKFALLQTPQTKRAEELANQLTDIWSTCFYFRHSDLS